MAKKTRNNNYEKVKSQNIESENKDKQSNIKNKIYFSYNLRLVTSLIVFIIAFSTFLYLVINSYVFKQPEKIKYEDTHEIDYKVYLKPNDFYEQDYLEKNMMYVANLIDKIDINFNYKFNIEKESTIDFNYKIIGDLIISNSITNANYFEKEYTLFESDQNTMKNDTQYKINKNIEVDYDYYNNLANSFKTSYGVDSESYLKVYLQVNKDGKKYNIDISNNSDNGITIPLSENSVQIKFDSNDVNNIGEILLENEWNFNPQIFVLEVVSFVILVISLYKIIKLLLIIIKPKSPYDKFIEDTLRTYDRVIGETKTGINFSEYNVIEMNTFEELLDIRDNLKMPIMYYNVTKHQKCYFYIKHNNDVYLLQVKAVDLERANNEK